MSASPSRRPLSALAAILLSASSAAAQQQPTKKGTANTFEVVGTSGVSAQQVCPVVALAAPGRAKVSTTPTLVNRCSSAVQIGCVTSIPTALPHYSTTRNQVYIIDKTENNPVQVNGHPAWATGGWAYTCIFSLPTRPFPFVYHHATTPPSCALVSAPAPFANSIFPAN